MGGRRKKEVGRTKSDLIDPAEIVIRPFKDRDNEEVWRLHVEAQEELGLPYDIPERDGDLKQIPEAYGQPGSRFWIAEAGAGPIATAAIRRVNAETAELKRMRVSSKYRRRGLAQHMLLTAERFCRDQGYSRIVLDTTSQQEAARRLYSKNGYRTTGTRALGSLTIFDYEKVLS